MRGLGLRWGCLGCRLAGRGPRGGFGRGCIPGGRGQGVRGGLLLHSLLEVERGFVHCAVGDLELPA